MSASEFVEQLEADPEFKRKQAVRESELAERVEEYRRDEAGLVAELRALGYDIDSVWDFVNNSPHPVLSRRFVGSYERAYSIFGLSPRRAALLADTRRNRSGTDGERRGTSGLRIAA